MGSGASSLSNAKSYSEKSVASKKIADDILTALFSRTDFVDLLELSSLNSCPKYIFTTADALSTLFTKLQIEPQEGRKGEILFAPVARVAPTEGVNTSVLMERNSRCLKIAYYYIRTFQIYAALALTVMETNPSKRYSTPSTPKVGVKQSQPSTAFLQSGGAISASSRAQLQKQYWKLFDKTPMVAIAPYLTPDTNDQYTLTFDSAPKGYAFQLRWPEQNEVKGDIVTLQSTWITPTFQVDNKPFTIQAKDTTTVELSIEGNPLAILKYLGGKWKFKYDEISYDNAIEFYTDLTEYFKQYDQSSLGMQRRPAIQGASTGSFTSSSFGTGSVSRPLGGSSTPAGPAFFGFEDIKKLFKDSKSTKGLSFFPKAYCIGRAMTLADPVFYSEFLASKQPYVACQVCSSKLDFEPSGAEFMPRPGKTPKGNIYFKSLIALFYDSYDIRSGEVRFTQTEDGRSKLQEASELFSDLYYVQNEKKQFLESEKQFPSYGLCEKTANQTLAIYNTVEKGKYVKELYTKHIQPMLEYQQKHTAKVNILLKEMFEVQYSADKIIGIRFTPKLRNGGIPTLNEYGKKANRLLLEYYLESEGRFINAIRFLRANPKALSPPTTN